MKQFAPHAVRNSEPIREVLSRFLPRQGRVLEVASGTGQHAFHFSRAFPGIQWQPSDRDEEALASIEAWRRELASDNLLPPIALDIAVTPSPLNELDAVFCANMIHISPWESCLGLLAHAARCLRAGGILFLYGPYRVHGQTAPSNERFDQSLRQRDPHWGLRELDQVEQEAMRHALVLRETIEMPANNLCVVFGLDA